MKTTQASANYGSISKFGSKWVLDIYDVLTQQPPLNIPKGRGRGRHQEVYKLNLKFDTIDEAAAAAKSWNLVCCYLVKPTRELNRSGAVTRVF